MDCFPGSSTWIVSVRSSESASMIKLPGTSDTASAVSASSRSESDASWTVVTCGCGSRGRIASQDTWTLATTTSQRNRASSTSIRHGCSPNRKYMVGNGNSNRISAPTPMPSRMTISDADPQSAIQTNVSIVRVIT